MAEPTLQSVFGSGATQNSTTLTILKADLSGLTASSNNTAESLLAGILRKASGDLNDVNRDANIDQSVSIDLTQAPNFATRTYNGVSGVYVRNTITVELDKSYPSTEIDPDDY